MAVRIRASLALALAIANLAAVAEGPNVFDHYNGGSLTLSCYTGEALCRRAELGVYIGPSASNDSVHYCEPYPGGRLRIWYQRAICENGGRVSSADADGCWTWQGDCVPIESNCPVTQVYDAILRACVTPDSPDPELGADRCPEVPYVGNPINAATGNKFERETDVARQGDSSLHFERYYNSRLDSFVRSSFGHNWTHTYEMRLVVAGDALDSDVFVYLPNGSGHQFRVSNGEYTSATARDLQLRVAGSGWEMTGHDGEVFTFDELGRLIGIDHRGQPDVTLTYDEYGRLDRVQDETGNFLAFDRDWSFRITSVTNAAGSQWQYSYDTAGNLKEVVFPDRTVNDDADNPRRVYVYEDARFLSNLTGIIDERSNRISTWEYDEQGRAISSQHAGGVDSHTLVFNADGSTTVTDPHSNVRVYTFEIQQGIRKLSNTVGGECSSCASNTASYTYDANGYVETKTDFNGNVTRYVRDDFGRELSRTEAEGTPQARVITTAWDNSINKPLVITEPGRVTTFTYDAQGRLESRVVQSQP